MKICSIAADSRIACGRICNMTNGIKLFAGILDRGTRFSPDAVRLERNKPVADGTEFTIGTEKFTMKRFCRDFALRNFVPAGAL